jgi:hypothetical protein
MEGVLLKPLPYPHANELVGVRHRAPGINVDQLDLARSNYFIFREQNHVLQDIGMYQADSVNVTDRDAPEQVQAVDVTDSLLSVLGVAPVMGNTFSQRVRGALRGGSAGQLFARAGGAAQLNLRIN